MGWIKDALSALKQGNNAQIRPKGGSMRGRIESGQLVTLAPVRLNDIQLEDVVFIKWKGTYILHIVKDIQEDNVLIGNNLGKINGWASGADILAKVIQVED